ncbi:hypothetical protein L6452_16157 [Arctium lappa]|uniref:Uncharacterized protein n=1 Tax=Arctium lappa TaxID=4217 RepID=A0ACB9BZV5_ARCLA|nr:hypothetical protein L6452_16157 [Arctium lappa]
MGNRLYGENSKFSLLYVGRVSLWRKPIYFSIYFLSCNYVIYLFIYLVFLSRPTINVLHLPHNDQRSSSSPTIRFVTMLHQYLNSIKKGSAKEVALASHAIGLLALTAGSGKKAQEILEEAVSPISEALKSRSDPSKIALLLDCLAVITFVGGNEPEETDKCMQIMWQVVHPKLGPNVVATKPSPPIITAMVSAWSFLLTTMDGLTLDPKSWQGLKLILVASILEQTGSSPPICAYDVYYFTLSQRKAMSSKNSEN